jgi:hypothetical protein
MIYNKYIRYVLYYSDFHSPGARGNPHPSSLVYETSNPRDKHVGELFLVLLLLTPMNVYSIKLPKMCSFKDYFFWPIKVHIV